jgi:hypothetical protein
VGEHCAGSGLVEGGCDSGNGTVDLLELRGDRDGEGGEASIECDCATIPLAQFGCCSMGDASDSRD